MALQFLPMLVIGPWGGVIADRWPKRRLLFITHSVAGGLALLLGVLVQGGLIQLWMVYALALGFGLTSAFDTPARQAFVMEMVGRDNVSNAVSLNATLVNMARIVGPAIAGVLIAGFGLAPCFFINAVTFGAVLIALVRMDSRQLFSAPLGAKLKGQLRAGFSYIRQTPVIRNLLLMMLVVGTFTIEFIVVLPLLARITFHGDARLYAAFTAVMSAGSVVGGLLVANLSHERKVRSAVRSALALGATVLLLAITPSVSLALVALFLVGMSLISFTATGNAVLQLASSPQMRGRVMALWVVGFLGTTPIGGPIIGYISQHTSPRWGLAVGGVAAVVAGLYGLATIYKAPVQPVQKSI